MRIAFLTPEFITENPSGGGLASYLGRMTALLRDLGHEVEVFTLSHHPPLAVQCEGIRVQRVQPLDTWLTRTLACHWRLHRRVSGVVNALRGAAGLAQALAAREREAPFDLVQSSDYGLAGLCVPRRRGRPHLTRCSWLRSAYEAAAGCALTFDNRMLRYLERRCLRRADAVYAPSRFIAQQAQREARRPVAVLRPPLPTAPGRFASAGAAADARPLPPRYLVYVGQLSPLKGCDVLAAALPQAWAVEPELRMLWIGAEVRGGTFNQWAQHWGPHRSQVAWLGSVPRDELRQLVSGAAALVCPSRCDNLPNTVIEALSWGVPVIGSAGASIDELVIHGRSGLLGPIGDAAALADLLVRAWRGACDPLRQGSLTLSEAFSQMGGEEPARQLIRLAGYDDGNGCRARLAA
jgi:glycosyltransferase involved in cell wall biosynthesis